MIGFDNTVLMNTPFGGIDKLKTVYFIGIGGIGMSAIARYFKAKGVKVSGYDKTPTELTRELEADGIGIHYEDNVALIPGNVQLVVFTPAVPADHRELVYFRQQGLPVVKRSDVLGWITESSFNICVAGTHGKTTISTMIAHLLRDSGYGCNAFLGGIAVNYGTNFWAQDKSEGNERNVCVIEADEYDRSFLKLSPDMALITAMDPDHLDIYGTAESMEEAFIDFSKRIKPGGMLLTKWGLKRENDFSAERAGGNIRHLTYSLQNKKADAFASNIRLGDGSYQFDFVHREQSIEEITLQMGGMHNVENAVAAIMVASSLGINDDKIRSAVKSFKGVKRRFEYITRNDAQVYIDDYAHHPEELKALITGAMNLFKKRRCTVIFQPHLFSRTRDLADAFAASLDLADEIILLPIYPARELPIPGVKSELILDKMKSKKKSIMTKEQLIKWVADEYNERGRGNGQMLITAGAGDIDNLVEPIKQILNKG